MKIIIVAQHNPELIAEVIEKSGHAVVAQTDDLAHLLTLLIQHSPHICIAEMPTKPEGILEQITARFPATKFVLLDYDRGNGTWTQAIRRALAAGPVQLKWCPTEPERRVIVMDLRYLALSSAQKLKRPVLNEGWQTRAGTEKLRLFWMLRNAAQVQERAEAYRDAVSTLEGSEWQEIVYRMMHSSFKSVSWARDQIARYTGYLSHFVPGADIDCVMSAVPRPAGARFLNYESPLEFCYSVYCLSLFGFNPDLTPPLVEVINWRYVGESTEDLTRTAIAATGLAFSLKTVALSQAAAVGWLLDPDTPQRLAWQMPRPLRRTLQTFRDFWGFSTVLDLEDMNSLAALLEEFHANPTQEDLPETLRIPSFADYHNATQDNQTNKTKSN